MVVVPLYMVNAYNKKKSWCGGGGEEKDVAIL
jgi:hypothetical protein